MSSSFESLNLGCFAFSISFTLFPLPSIVDVNIFEMNYLVNQGFLLIRRLGEMQFIYLLFVYYLNRVI